MDEKIILDLLNRNFDIVIIESGDFVVRTKNTEITNKKQFFEDKFKKLIGDFKINDEKTSIDVFYSWCEYLQRDIVKDLYQYLDTLDGKKGSNTCLDELITKFDSSSPYSIQFLYKIFDEYYMKKFLHDELTEFLKDFDYSIGSQLFLSEVLRHFSKDINRFSFQIEEISILEYKNRINTVIDTYLDTITDEINSVTLVNNAPIDIEKEIDDINTYIYNRLNIWYAKTHLNDKVDKFLTELVVTLGRTNWIVTWVGHGQIDKTRLLAQFIEEDTYHETYIAKKYHDWYENAIINKSEKIMNINY